MLGLALRNVDEEIRLIRPQFDPAYYAYEYPDVQVPSAELVRHFCLFGWKEGRNPNSFFDTVTYLDQYRDVLRSGMNPFFHYLNHGRFEGRQAQPSISPSVRTKLLFGYAVIEWVRRLQEQIDVEYYLSKVENLAEGVDPVAHFAFRGWRAGVSPNPLFDVGAFCERYPKYSALGVNPVLVKQEIDSGRFRPEPNPSQTVVCLPNSGTSNEEGIDRSVQGIDCSPEIPIIRAEFDEAHYRMQLQERGLEVGAQDVVAHYFEIGAALGLNPNEEFSTAYYLKKNPDVGNAGVNVFWHYLVAGRVEGRKARDVGEADVARDELAAIAAEFDREYYLALNPDVAAAGIDPLLHFANTGWREGRDPNRTFSVKDYLSCYPDVEQAGLNPFLHFVAAGRAEGRMPRQELGFRYEIIRSLRPLEEVVAAAKSHFGVNPGDEDCRLRQRLLPLMENSHGLFLTVSHDDYTANVGGVQLCLMRESKKIAQLGWTHLHLFPTIPLPVLASSESEFRPGVLLNGAFVGVFTPKVIEMVLREMSSPRPPCAIAIHSLLGHDCQALLKIADAASVSIGWFWIHDFASICAGYNLMRNDVEYCGAPPADSGACFVCRYGGYRRLSRLGHESLLDRLNLTAVAPSTSALELWRTKMGSHRHALVHEHCRLSKGQERVARKSNSPLRVAFLGYPVAHKGWFVFRDLVMKCAGMDGIEFVHLGKVPDRSITVEFHPVEVTQTQLSAMTDAVRDFSIDVAIIWSLWPETFCFTAYEAVAGGAAVFTSRQSGNVARLVQNTGIGRVFGDETELCTFMSTLTEGAIERCLSQHYYHLEYSNMTADLLEHAVP